jgi:hypothetical protein
MRTRDDNINVTFKASASSSGNVAVKEDCARLNSILHHDDRVWIDLLRKRMLHGVFAIPSRKKTDPVLHIDSWAIGLRGFREDLSDVRLEKIRASVAGMKVARRIRLQDWAWKVKAGEQTTTWVDL